MLTKFLYLFVVFAVIGLSKTADAVSCADPGTEPLTPGMVDDNRLLNGLNECCCYNNNINVFDSDMELHKADMCCDISNEDCDTYWVAIMREAEPYVVEEYINRVDANGDLVYDTVIQNSLDQVCICSGGYSQNCIPTMYLTGFPQTDLYYFYCDPCTPDS